MSGEDLDGRALERLFEVIESRRGTDPGESHTAALFARGPRQIAKKLGEEAVETVIEGASDDGAESAEGRARLVSESADLLYHLLVLWSARGVCPAEVWAELERRSGTSGIAEKAARSKE